MKVFGWAVGLMSQGIKMALALKSLIDSDRRMLVEATERSFAKSNLAFGTFLDIACAAIAAMDRAFLRGAHLFILIQDAVVFSRLGILTSYFNVATIDFDL